MKLKYIDYENEIFVKAKIKLLEVKKKKAMIIEFFSY